MSAIDLDPVLVIGGSGVVGRRAVAALRHLQPELRIAVGGRDLGRAEAVAAEVHHPERLLDPGYVVQRLADFGARIEQA